VNGVAHESKAGIDVALNSRIRKQILKDAELKLSGAVTDVHWHFFQGADSKILAFLKQHGIGYTLH
jgi:hypothetical protein